jgi:hypothetical protein
LFFFSVCIMYKRKKNATNTLLHVDRTSSVIQNINTSSTTLHVYLPSWPFIGATEYLRQIKTGFKKHKTSEKIHYGKFTYPRTISFISHLAFMWGLNISHVKMAISHAKFSIFANLRFTYFCTCQIKGYIFM